MFLRKQIKFTCFIFTLFIIGKINAQTFAFNLQSNNLNFGYSNITDFTGSRTIANSFTFNITNSTRGRYNIYGKIVPTGFVNIAEVPTNIFSIKANSANFTLSNSAYQPTTLGLNDVIIATVANRPRLSDSIRFDLILNSVSLNFNPNTYPYNFVFTVTEF
jgi:hypothetical protein